MDQPVPEIDQRSQRRAIRLLTTGALLGLLLATSGLLELGDGARDSLPEEAVASVNGRKIRVDDYERLLAGLESDTRAPIDLAARRHVLDRMIDEELLVQRALELGLAELDRRVRADLTSSLIASVVTSAEDRDPEQQELRAFYAEEGDFFTQPGRFRVRQIFFRVSLSQDEGAAREQARAARAALARGEDFAAVAAQYGDDEISPLPQALLPAQKLREYIGPTAMQAVLALEVGETSEPVRSGVGLHLLELLESKPASRPAFESIEQQLANEWRRRRGDHALRSYLDELRASSELRIRPELAAE